VTDPTADRLWAAIAPFAWDKDDVEEILTALTPVVDRLCCETAAKALEAAADGYRAGDAFGDGEKYLRARAAELLAKVAE
jgi:hypothetical protein